MSSQGFFRASLLCACFLMALSVKTGSAGELNRIEKEAFLQEICAGWTGIRRCLSGGKLALKLSINWIMFEACSWSGNHKTKVRCFDQATNIAAEKTGDDAYLNVLNYCHRFQGENNDDIIVRFFRYPFKYSTHNLKTYQKKKAG